LHNARDEQPKKTDARIGVHWLVQLGTAASDSFSDVEEKYSTRGEFECAIVK